jgi:hypothetical protein
MPATPALAVMLKEEVRRYVRRKVRAWTFFALAGVAALFMIGYLIAAGHEAIAERTDPLTADFILAGGMAIVAIVLAVIGLLFAKKPRRERIASKAASVGLPFAAGLVARRAPWMLLAIGAIALAGMALGRSSSGKS